jgi:hypothetical protein
MRPRHYLRQGHYHDRTGSSGGCARRYAKNDRRISDLLAEKDLLKKRIEEFGKNDSLLKTAKEKDAAKEFSNDFNVFEQRQLQFLAGKILEKDVKLENGDVLKAGEQISQEALAGVKSRHTLMQLTAHVMK